MTPESNDLNQVPWEARIAGFNALEQLSHRVMKNAMLMNGAAAVAIMAYLGKGQYQPAHGCSLALFAGGVLFSALACIGAYMSQWEYNRSLGISAYLEPAITKYNTANAGPNLDTMADDGDRKLAEDLNRQYKNLKEKEIKRESSNKRGGRWEWTALAFIMLSLILFVAGVSTFVSGFKEASPIKANLSEPSAAKVATILGDSYVEKSRNGHRY